MKKLVILQTTVPDYRAKVFKEIKKHLGDRFGLYAGEEYFEPSIKKDISLTLINNVNNNYFFHRKMLLQTGMFRDLLEADIAILEMNPRIVSNWVLLLVRKMFKKKTVLWGHAWPRAGRGSKSDKIRNLMRSFADEIIVYTETQKEELQHRMPQKVIRSAPNALYSVSEMQPGKEEQNEINNIIYVGRLTKAKKCIALVRSFMEVLDDLPKDSNLIIIGEGEEFEQIKDLVESKKLSKRIKLLGHVSDYELLKEQYSKSLFSASPGYVGLSITQSLGFGVPMLISKHENHSPEIEAAEEGKNTVFFATDDKMDLNKEIKGFFENKDYWIQQRAQISKECQKKYSVEAMAQTFIQLGNSE